MANPFDLNRRIPKPPQSQPSPVRVSNGSETISITKEEKESLAGFILVRRNEWEKLPVNTEIKFYNVKGQFRKGGFIHYNGGKRDGRKFFRIKTGFSETSSIYQVNYTTIRYLWKRRTVQPKETDDLRSAIIKMNRNLAKLNKFMIDKYGNEYKLAMRQG